MDIDEILSAMRKMLRRDEKSALKELGESAGDPFRVLIGTILSQRTRDEKTAEAVRRLFSRFRSLEELAGADPSEVADLIKPVGFYKSKSVRIVEVAKIIRDKHGGAVPRDFKELLNLPSVGRKTANCVLLYGFGMDAIPVDTHVHRIANRIGIVKTKTPEGTEERLMKSIPRSYWKEINDLFVSFGKSVCRPIGPKCGICLIKDACEYNKKVSGR
ncbi:MAG: endonuclease III domain-containing protein [Candidatus Methanomethylicaceae archaeon]